MRMVKTQKCQRIVRGYVMKRFFGRQFGFCAWATQRCRRFWRKDGARWRSFCNGRRCSYLMMNSEVLSTVMTGRKLIIVVCDNGGYAVIDRLQNFKGNASFNNLFRHCRGKEVPVDFVAHAKSMGADGEQVNNLAQLSAALKRARKSRKTYMIAMRTAKSRWTPGDAWWDVGVPEVSTRKQVRITTLVSAKTTPRRIRAPPRWKL